MNAVTTLSLDPEIIANLVTNGDLKGLAPAQRIAYYNYRCQQSGLDPAAKPFDLLSLNGKLVLYANAGATQQLCANRKLTVEIISKEKQDDLYIVCARVTDPDGRHTDNMGVVPIGSLKGEVLSNALMKGTTKAIRRTVLAHCGLGMLDETEAATIPGAQVVALEAAGAPITPHPDTSSVDPEIVEQYVDGIRTHLNVNDARGLKELHEEVKADELLYSAVWKCLTAPERRRWKELVSQAVAA